VIAVGSLLRIMLVRRNQVVDEWQAKVAAEQKKQKKPAPPGPGKH
jgi:hypothetical protein